MNLMDHVLVTEAVESFHQTYLEFLKTMGLADESVVRVGFYTGALKMVRADPMPNPEVQAELEKFLEQTLNESIGEIDDDLMSCIKIAYQTVSRDRLDKFHAGHDCEVVSVDHDEWLKWMR